MGEVADTGIPDIDPSAFDLIVIGTGFQEALLAGYGSLSSQKHRGTIALHVFI